MMAGYLTPEGIDSSAIHEGWFQNGDLGFIDAAGRVHLVGRESEVVNVFGMKVIPSEVESVIRDFPGVADVKVYAGQHRSGSQIVKAAVAGRTLCGPSGRIQAARGYHPAGGPAADSDR
jgi:acyl-CoA synthetase (AMP-forming)/AMP-acid ligase II